ncbi:hypothetical protein D3C75_1376940 [compost metagenome]
MGGSEQIPPMDLLTEEKTKGGSAVIGISSEEKLKQFVQDTMTAPEPSPSPEASPGSSPSASAGSK